MDYLLTEGTEGTLPWRWEARWPEVTWANILLQSNLHSPPYHSRWYGALGAHSRLLITYGYIFYEGLPLSTTYYFYRTTINEWGRVKESRKLYWYLFSPFTVRISVALNIICYFLVFILLLSSTAVWWIYFIVPNLFYDYHPPLSTFSPSVIRCALTCAIVDDDLLQPSIQIQNKYSS